MIEIVLVIGAAVAGLWWWHTKANAAGVIASGWVPAAAGTASIPGTYRFSIPVPASAGVAPADVASALQAAATLMGWVNPVIYMPGTTFPSDWPDTDPTELRFQVTLPPGVTAPMPINPSMGSKGWYQASSASSSPPPPPPPPAAPPSSSTQMRGTLQPLGAWASSLPTSLSSPQWLVVYGWSGSAWSVLGGNFWVVSTGSSGPPAALGPPCPCNDYQGSIMALITGYQYYLVYLWDPTTSQWSTYQSW